MQPAIRWSSFRSSEVVTDIQKHPHVEVIKSPPEWKFVEALLPQKRVPQIVAKQEYPSTWKPPTVNAAKVSYMVTRTKNHMMPVYLKRTHRGLRRLTVVRHVEGDIWGLHNELKALVEKSINKEITSRVNEMNGQIWLRGDYVVLVHDYLQKKGY